MAYWFTQLPTVRKTFFLLFILSLLILFIDAYIQSGVSAESCAMDFLERLMLFMFCFLCLTASLQLQTPKAKKVYSAIGFFICCLGVFVAGKHWWVQGLSSSQLGYYLDVPYTQLSSMNFQQILITGFKGARECAPVYWIVGGLSMAGWFLLVYLLLALLSLFQFFRSKM